VEPLAIAMAVLSGALHAAWNAAVKASGDASAAMTVQVATAGVIAALVLLWIGPPPLVALPWLLASSSISVAALLTTRRAYASGAFSVVYPLSRALAPAIVALVGGVIGFGWPSTTGALGLAAIALGVAAFLKPTPGTPISAAIGWSMATAVLTAAFILIDSNGVRASGDLLAYGLAVSAANGLAFAVIERRTLVPAFRRQWRIALFAPPASLGSYLLILWVWRDNSPALGAALRDTSLIFAALIGWQLLGERPSRATWVAIALCTMGIVALRFG
jgi:uncharacterized membrane protein